VDPARLAITGASGGGNQTLYAGATDDRLKVVVPVCGIGTYEAYLTSACCVCEVNVGGLNYALTGDLLAMVAPRALLVVSATRDAFQFSVGEARKSIDYARGRFRLLGHADRLRHVAIESGHDYNRAMREALYGWLDRWLRDRGDGGPIPEPEVKVEEVSALRCYPDAASRPKTIVTIPQFARSEGLARLAALPSVPDHRERWQAESVRLSNQLREAIFSRYPPALRDTLLGGSFPGMRIEMSATVNSGMDHLVAVPERGLQVAGRVVSIGKRGTVLALGDGGAMATDTPTNPKLLGSREDARSVELGWVDVGLRAIGIDKPATPAVAGVADHNEAEWGLWVGRPLVGQWVLDTIRWMTALDEWRLSGRRLPSGRPFPSRPYILGAHGPLGLVALLAAALDPRVEAVMVSGCLVSFVAESDRSWSNVPMGLLVPNLLDVADVAQVAGLIAPRRLVIVGGVVPEGGAATAERLNSAFSWTRDVYKLLGAEENLVVGTEDEIPPGFPADSRDARGERAD
jgi:hypothetical protein